MLKAMDPGDGEIAHRGIHVNHISAAIRRRAVYAAAALLIGLGASVAVPIGASAASAASLESSGSSPVSVVEFDTVASEGSLLLGGSTKSTAPAAEAEVATTEIAATAETAATAGMIYPTVNGLSGLADGPRRVGVLLFTVLGLAFFGIAAWGRRNPEREDSDR
jgi:hypothetical protein